MRRLTIRVHRHHLAACPAAFQQRALHLQRLGRRAGDKRQIGLFHVLLLEGAGQMPRSNTVLRQQQHARCVLVDTVDEPHAVLVTLGKRLKHTVDMAACSRPTLNGKAGLAVQGGSGTSRHVDGMLQALAEGDEDRMRLVHRIDKDTSGVLLLAKDRVAARHLTRAFQQQDMEKTYLALVTGAPPETLEMKGALLKRGGAGGEMMAVDPDGQPSHSSLRLIEAAGIRMALVALQPRTGRTHQLRVHMAHEGHPIIGDGKYGGARAHTGAHPGGGIAGKLHLHAWRLRLADGTLIEAPLPAHFRDTLATLGLAVPGADWQFAARR